MKSKRAEPGENRNESARGTLGREKERRPLKEPLRRREQGLSDFFSSTKYSGTIARVVNRNVT